MKGNGNCLFGALCVARLHQRGQAIPQQSEIQAMAQNLRRNYLNMLQQKVAQGAVVDGIPVQTFVEVGSSMAFATYLRVMGRAGDCSDQWGGFVEACLIALWARCSVCVLHARQARPAERQSLSKA